jgi:hypothetical protein
MGGVGFVDFVDGADRISVFCCHTGANQRRLAGSAYLTGRLRKICAGDAAPARWASLKSSNDLANMLASKEPHVQDPVTRFSCS